MKAVTKHWN